MQDDLAFGNMSREKGIFNKFHNLTINIQKTVSVGKYVTELVSFLKSLVSIQLH
jgi:hypothetical protein